MTDRLRRALPAMAGFALFAAALEVLRYQLAAVTWQALVSDVAATPRGRLAVSLACTAASYVALVGYDLLAFRVIGKALPMANVAFAAFLSYAISNNVGFAMLSGASMRYRFYARWGVTVRELSGIVVAYSITFWIGLFALGGLSLLAVPDSALAPFIAPSLARLLAGLLVALPLAYVTLAAISAGPLRIGGWHLPRPSVRLALAQLAVSIVDWSLAGAALYALLPHDRLSYLQFIGPFLMAVLLGLASHLPGGVGVFEGAIVLAFGPVLSASVLLPRLVLYRLVYYVLPLLVALALFVADEWRLRQASAARFMAGARRVGAVLIPNVFGALAFLAGLILLVSGATPAAAGRLERLHRFLPLGVIEVSHFVGSVVGALLLILSQGLVRRLDAAYYFTAFLLAIGIGASLLKGLDYEEATLLALILTAGVLSRRAFRRRAAFFATRFSPAWLMSVAGAVAGSVWIASFAFKHAAETERLWWEFALDSQASRSLRASMGAALVMLFFGVARLARRPPSVFVPPSAIDLADAAAIIATQADTAPNLALLGDKMLLFNETRTAFLMYGVQGRFWIAMGDPVGPDQALPALVRTFLERATDEDAVPVLYEVSASHLGCYADFGLTFVKIGEEARVNLDRFTVEGPCGAPYRKLIRRLEKDGCGFDLIAPPQGPSLVSELRGVSDDWLAARAHGEKGFSLGFFDPAYVARFPVAVVRRGNRVVAFAVVWQSADHAELSVDLMRFSGQAPRSAMEALFAHLLVWGKAQGYRWFSLGMAPLAGVATGPVAPLWNRFGSFVYRHGGSVYNFQGLRGFKAKFDPVWTPRYLVYPGGTNLPRLLTDLAALVAGGYRRLFRR